MFDDYIPNEIGGVTQVIDEEVIPNFDVTLIKTNVKVQGKKVGVAKNELNLCWMKSSSLKKPLQDVYPKSKSDKIISKYLKWEKRWRLRKALNTKIPALGRLKFRH